MKKILILALGLALIHACGNTASDTSDTSSAAKETTAAKVDDGKGVGEIKSVSLNDPLQPELIAQGKEVYELKCAACHRLTDQRVVGPGFKGITERRKPEWIMNMILNTEAMLAEDPTAQALLEECLTRMPNQNIKPEDARAILEFLYDNDSGS